MLSTAHAELFPLVGFPPAGILQLVPAAQWCSFPSSPSQYKPLFLRRMVLVLLQGQHCKAVINQDAYISPLQLVFVGSKQLRWLQCIEGDN